MIFAEDQQTSMQARLRHGFATSIRVSAEVEPNLAAALEDTLARPGNFIRAELAFDVACSYGLADADSERLALAMEYFHTASLLFDDLPSMDNATKRRGALCIHHLHGEGSTILAALALINCAYGLLWRAMVAAPAAAQREAFVYVERYLGLGGLLNGQSQDIHYAALPISGRDPQQIAMGKTVALIRLSLVLPALVGGAGARTVQLLNRLAIFWGLAYQILDDIKDLQQESEISGKTTARDRLLDRPNMALTLGYAETVRRLNRLIKLGGDTVAELRQSGRPMRADGMEEKSQPLACLDRVSERFREEVSALALETRAEIQAFSR